MLPLSSRPRRSAFTLLELLVVIAIIAILASLLLAAIFKAHNVVEEVQNRNDISELDKACYAFANSSDLGAPGFFPSHLALPATLPANPPNTPDIQFMIRAFPKAITAWQAGTIDWSGVGAGGVTLNGQQALVYFLRGPTGQGWSKNPSNPCDMTASKISFFYEFKGNRLVPGPGGPPMYNDVFGTPIAYINTSNAIGNPGTDSPGAPAYADPGTGLLVNPMSFQIISAGRNHQFGPGGATPLPLGMTTPGGDDFTNFWSTRLGAKGQ